jgi:hypothetical protein
VTTDDNSYRAQLDYAGDRYGVQLEQLSLGDNFNPEVGYVRRDDMDKSYAQFRFSPRPKSIKAIRKFAGIGSINYIEDRSGRLETRTSDGEFAIEFQNSDRFSVGVNQDFEFLKAPFTIVPGVRIPIGGYEFTRARAGYNLGQQRPVSGNVSVEVGAFYNGHRNTLTFNRSRLNVSNRFSLEPSLSINWIELPSGSFRTRLVGSRVTYTMTPLMFVSSLVQYNSSTHVASTNVRLRWEYQPGSEIFVVYNDERNSLAPGFPDLSNNALIIKINRLFRF